MALTSGAQPENLVDAGVRIMVYGGDAQRGLDDIGTSLGRSTKKMKEFIGQGGYLRLALARIATYTAIFTFFGGLVKLIGEVISLEERLVEVSTLVDMRNKDMAKSFQRVTESLLGLSPYLGSSIDLTKGLYEIMSAGVTQPVEAFKLLVVSARYAKAGLVDLATAASSLTAIMKAYGYTADEMRAKSDMLFASVMEGKFHADELNSAIGKVLPTAAAMGIQIDEVSAALAVLTQRGLDVNEAATALNRMMLSFLRPIDKAKKWFEKLGWEYGRNAFMAGGLQGVLHRLQNATTRYSDLLPQVFRRQRALRAGFVLAGEGLKDYDRLLLKIQKSTEGGGEVQRAYGKMIKTVGEEFKAMKAALLKAAQGLLKYTGAMAGLVRALRWLTVSMVEGAFKAAAFFLGLKLIGKLIPTIIVSYLNQATAALTLAKAEETATFYVMKHNTAMLTGKMRLARWGSAMTLASSAALAATGVFLILNKIIKEFGDSISDSINEMIQHDNRTAKSREQLKLLSEVVREATGTYENLNVAVKKVAIANVEKMIMGYKNAKELFYALQAQMKKREGYLEMVAWKDEIWELAKAIEAGNYKIEDHEAIMMKLVRTFKLFGKAQDEVIERTKLRLDVYNLLRENERELLLITRDLTSALEAADQHPLNLAELFDKEELMDLHRVTQLMLKEDMPAYVRFSIEEHLRGMGMTFEKALEILGKSKEQIKKALRQKDWLDFELMLEDFGRTFKAVIEANIPPVENLHAATIALQAGWATVSKLGIKDVSTFVNWFSSHIKVLVENIDRFTDEGLAAAVKEWKKHLDKAKDPWEKLAEKAQAAMDKMGAAVRELASIIAQQEAAIWGESWEIIVEKARAANEKKMVQLDEWLAAELKAHKDSTRAWEVYYAALELMQERYQNAVILGYMKWIEIEAKQQRKLLRETDATAYQRYLAHKAFIEKVIAMLSKWGIADEKLREQLMKHAEEMWKEEELLAKRTYRRISRAFGDLIGNVLTGTESISEAWRSMGKALINIWSDVIGEIITEWIKGKQTLQQGFESLVQGTNVWIIALGVVLTVLDSIFTKSYGISRRQADVIRDQEKLVANVVLQAVTVEDLYGSIGGLVDSLAGKFEKLGLSVAESKERLEEMLSDLLDMLKETGREGEKAFLDLIWAMRAAGQESKVLTEYFLEWLDVGVEGLQKMMDIAGTSEEELHRLTNLTLSLFNAMIAEGRSWGEALALLHDPLIALRDSLVSMGVEGGAAIDQLLEMAQLRAIYPELFAAIDGNVQVLQALGNTGYLTAETLADAANQAQQYYQTLIDMGLSAEQALAIMAPTLAQIQYYAEQNNIVLDEATQAWIDQAEAAGLLGGAGLSMTQILVSGFDAIIEKLTELVDILTGRFIPALQSAGDVMSDIHFGGGDIPIPAIPGAARGITDIGSSQLVRLHRGESVIPERISEALRQFYGGATSPIRISEGEDGIALVNISVDGRQFYKALVPYIREGNRYGDTEINADGVF